MASDKERPRHHTTPELNYQNWDDFHSSTGRDVLFSIDILLTGYPDPEIPTEHGAKLVTESAELPERIRINSNYIAQIIRNLHPSNDFRNEPIIMFRPYKALVMFDQDIRHSAMELQKKVEAARRKETQSPSSSDEEVEVQLSRLACLLRFMDKHLSPRISFLQKPECNAIYFSDLWLLYKPGDAVVHRDLLQAYQVMRVEARRKTTESNGILIVEEDFITIHCVHIDFDGTWLGPVPTKFVIKRWGHLQRVGSLELIPLTRAEAQREKLRQDLIRRGRTFVQVAHISPVNYKGYTLDNCFEVDGTIVIDFEEALRDKRNFKEWRTTIENYSEARMLVMGCDQRDDGEALTLASEHGNPHNDSYVDAMRHQKLVSSRLTMNNSGDKIPSLTILSRLLDQADPMTEDELLIMSHRVFGFTMDTAEWGVFDLSLASPIGDISSLQFDDLIIPSHIKELVKNLTGHHLKQMSSTALPNKSSATTNPEARGLVLILHGAPGVGKKTTAKCVARMANVPLMRLSTELALPYVTGEYKSYIEKSFFWAKRWGCIVMIDQAEIVLPWKPDTHRVPWNDGHQIVFRKTVKRMLDTFTGITFLITDSKPVQDPGLVESSDLDILSRVNASLLYPPLDKDHTVKIFELNMRWINDVFSKQHRDSPRPACLNIGEDVLQFARAFYKQRQPEDRWNCRQIQNAFSTALALAHADAEGSAEGQTDKEPQEPLKVTLKATHFEVFARSIIKSSTPQRFPVPPEPAQPMGPRPSQYTTGSVPPRSLQRAPQQVGTQRYSRTSQERQDQMIPPGNLVPNSRQLPPEEYRAKMPPPPLPPPPPTYSLPPPPPPPPPIGIQSLDIETGGQMLTRRPKEFFLASPLSLEARPELTFLSWDAFKDARIYKDDACSAIDVLVGEPVVSFDQEAQDSAWWSRWGDRKRAEGTRAKSDTNTAATHKGRGLAATQPSPLPERIRIHSKYITAFLEEIRGSKISKTSFVMVRPFKALTYYENKIRTKHKELAISFEAPSDDPAVGDGVLNLESVEQPEDKTAQLQPDGSEVVGNDSPLSGQNSKTPKDVDDASSTSSGSDDGEPVDTTTDAAFQHLACLVEFLDTIRARRQYLLSGSCSKVTFADVWHLFKPGDEVLDKEQRQAYRILSVNSSGHRTLPPWKDLDDEEDSDGDEPVMILYCVHITFDGAMLGSIQRLFEITSFEGEEDMTSLPVLPLRLVKDPDSEASGGGEAFRQDLIDRGRMFVRMAKSTPMHYNGPLLHPKEEVDSQVVIDFEQAFAFWANGPSFRRPFIEKLIGKPIGLPLAESPCLASCCAGEQVHEDAYAEQKWNESYIGTLIPDPQDRTKKPSLAIYPRAIRGKKFDETELTDEDLVIMSYKVCGFVLRTRKWAQMDLKYLSPLNSGGRATQAVRSTLPTEFVAKDANESAQTTLDQLVLPPGHKDIVKSLISQHFQDKATGRYEAEEKDVVRGKGKGLIILLHGAPGVGKTSTAEGVAEAFNKPLFQITSGDLGTNARELEDALEWHFYLAHKWDCVLLLDEADVFLSVRSPEDFQRNSLVAVFLRVLEYYAGVLFLTTNRIGDFDEAFSSRIHISLYYPPLKRSSTKKIFDLNLRNIQQRIEERGTEIEIEYDHILRWATDYWKQNKKMRWNGRQIRNACQTALALAEYDAQHPTGSTPDEGAEQEEISVEKAAKIRLTIGHLETVAKAYLEFMRYLHEIYGKDAERRAKALGIRAREFSTKNIAPSQEPTQEEEEDEESEDDIATGTETTKKSKSDSQQPSDPASNSTSLVPETSPPGLAPQHTPFPMAPYPYPPFPNMPNPYALPAAFGQNQQPPAAPYQQNADQQRQYFASMAAWNNMVAGGQQAPFPSMAGMPVQPPGGGQSQGGPHLQGGTSFPPGAGAGSGQ